MKTIKINGYSEIPKNHTGIAEYKNGTKYWYKEGKRHREDGPACEYSDGTKMWYKNDKLHRVDGPTIEYQDGNVCFFLEDKQYDEININDYVVLDHYKGKYGIMWYKLLDKDEIFEYPDILGLIIK